MAQSATNYAEKYGTELNQAYTRKSIIASHVNDEYSFDGVKTIHIYSAITQPLHDYKRSGSNRYGDPTEVETDIQDFMLDQDKAFASTIDTGNKKDNAALKAVGKFTSQQIAEQVTPTIDKYALNKWAEACTTDDGILGAEAPTKDNVVDMFMKARSIFMNQNINQDDSSVVYIPTSTTYQALLRNPDFISVEKLGDQHLSNGEVGKVMGWRLIEVPDAYLPEGVFALFTHKREVFAPTKIKEMFVRTNPQGISGTLIEGRYYYGAFVRKTMVNSTTTTKAAGEGAFKVHGVLAAKTAA